MGSENLTAWERWELASFDANEKKAETAGTAARPDDGLRLPTAAEIERIHQQAREEGYRQGREEGHQAGLREGQTKSLAEARRLAQAADKLDDALDRLGAVVADELLALAVEIAREVVRQELAARPEALLAVVREALAQLPHQHAVIYLNPDDASLLRAYVGDQLSHAGHRIVEDVRLIRGDCILEAGGTQIDATVATRWRRVLEGLGIAAAWQEP